MVDKGNYYQWYEKGHFESETRAWKEEKVSGTLCASGGGIKVATNNLKVRKLTPRECFRLMNVKNEDIDKILKSQSDISAYHLAGDSICTNVLMAIFGEMLDINWQEKLNDMLDIYNKGENK